MVKFGRAVFKIFEQADKQTDRRQSKKMITVSSTSTGYGNILTATYWTYVSATYRRNVIAWMVAITPNTVERVNVGSRLRTFAVAATITAINRADRKSFVRAWVLDETVTFQTRSLGTLKLDNEDHHGTAIPRLPCLDRHSTEAKNTCYIYVRLLLSAIRFTSDYPPVTLFW